MKCVASARSIVRVSAWLCGSAGGRIHRAVLEIVIKAVRYVSRVDGGSAITEAEVPPISLHGLRHTCATLLLAAGVQPQIVQERLGHKKIETTLSVYGHVLPGQQRDAARRLASILHG
jgi:integrase